MNKLDLKTVPKLKSNPIFEGLSDELKDPVKFDEVEKQLSTVMKSDHVHKKVKDFVTCAWCQGKLKERQDLMKKIGFTTYGQYLEWKKIMTIIKNKKSFELK